MIGSSKTILSNIDEAFKNYEQDVNKLYNDMIEETKKNNKIEEINRELQNKPDYNSKILRFIVSGKQINILMKTILEKNSTVFYYMILLGKINVDKEIFIERDSFSFEIIIDFLKYGEINVDNYDNFTLKKLKEECDFYEVHELSDILKSNLEIVKFVRLEMSSKSTISKCLNSLPEINRFEQSRYSGITTDKGNSFIILEFDRECYVKKIMLSTFNKFTTYPSTYGVGSKIFLSSDMIKWKQINAISHEAAKEIVTIEVNDTFNEKARYIKFTNDSHIGIGCIRIIERLIV